MEKYTGLKDENGNDVTLIFESNSICPRIEPAEPESNFVGKWYVHEPNIIAKYARQNSEIYRVCSVNENNVSYDITSSNLGNKTFAKKSSFAYSSRPATCDEIKKFLTEKINREYLGKKIIDLLSGKIHTVVPEGFDDDTVHTWNYSMENDTFCVASPHSEWHSGRSNPLVYQQGIWATIVPDKKPFPKTRKDLNDILNESWKHIGGGELNANFFKSFLDQYEDQ